MAGVIIAENSGAPPPVDPQQRIAVLEAALDCQTAAFDLIFKANRFLSDAVESAERSYYVGLGLGACVGVGFSLIAVGILGTLGVL